MKKQKIIKLSTTAINYNINFNELFADFDFYTLILKKDDKGQYFNSRNSFNTDYNFPINVYTKEHKKYIFILNKKDKLIKSKQYEIAYINPINIKDDDILNIVLKLSVKHDKSGRFSLCQQPFYYINSIGENIYRGLEPIIENKCLVINAVNYKKITKEQYKNKDKFIIQHSNDGPILKNSIYGDLVKKGNGKNNPLKQIPIYNIQAKNTPEMDATKTGAFFHTINMMNASKYTTIENTETFSNTINLTNFSGQKYETKTLTDVYNTIKKTNGISIISIDGDIKNEKILKNKIIEIFKNVDINISSLIETSTSTNRNVTKPSIYIHFDKEHYEEAKIADPYFAFNKEHSKQSITISEFGELNVNDTILIKILTELCIKIDLKNQHPPTFSNIKNILGYYMLDNTLYKYSLEKNSAHVSVAEDFKFNDTFLHEDSFIIFINDKHYMISKCNESTIPNINDTYSMLKSSNELNLKTILKEDFENWLYKLDDKNLIINYRKQKLNVDKYKESELKIIFSRCSEESVTSFKNEFGYYPKRGLRYNTDGQKPYDYFSRISLFDNKKFSIGTIGNIKNINNFTPVYKITPLESNESDEDILNILSNLYEHYYIRSKMSTTKPYFVKYIKEAIKAQLIENVITEDNMPF